MTENEQRLVTALQAALQRIEELQCALYKSRPKKLQGETIETHVGCGKLFLTLNRDESGKPFEVFFKLAKSGSCQQSYLEALGVAISVG